jgi:hypothetical protein
MAWPFERANALGFALFETFTSAQATLMDLNAASAASGAIWSDVSLVRNLLPIEQSFAIDDASGDRLFGQVLMWEPTRGRWWNFGTELSSDDPLGAYSYNGGDWIASPLESTLGGSMAWEESLAADHNGAGLIVLGGRHTGTFKICRSVDAGDTWVSASTITASTNLVTCVKWMPSANLFVAGFSNSATSNIETSPDGDTWTTRTAPNSNPRLQGGAAASPTRCVILANASTDKCITSEDGITWTERTLPAVAAWVAISWNAERAKFMVIATDNKVATSPDGITWTLVSSSGPGDSDTKLSSLYRLWLVMGNGNSYYVSIDDGANWSLLSNFTMTSGFTFKASDRQVLFAYLNTTRRSLIGGAL